MSCDNKDAKNDNTSKASAEMAHELTRPMSTEDISASIRSALPSQSANPSKDSSPMALQYGVVSCVLNAGNKTTDADSTTASGLLRVWSYHSSIESATATAKKLSTCSEAMRQIDFVVVDLSQWIPCPFDAQNLSSSTTPGAGAAADSKSTPHNGVDVVYTDHLYGSIMQGRIAKQLNDVSSVKARSEADNKQLTPVDLYDMAVTKRSNDLIERVLNKLTGDASARTQKPGVLTRSQTKNCEQLQKAIKEEIEKSREEAKDYVGMLMREANRKQKVFAEKMREADMNTLKSVEMEQKSKFASSVGGNNGGGQQNMLMTSNASGSGLAMPF